MKIHKILLMCLIGILPLLWFSTQSYAHRYNRLHPHFWTTHAVEEQLPLEEPHTFSAQVIGILDGDTIEVLRGRNNLRVRLADIDAPEWQQPYGADARTRLFGLCYQRPATITVVGMDRFDRLVAELRCGSVMVNETLVKEGYAWWYRHYSTHSKYEALEEYARRHHLGLWRRANPTSPWDYRRSHAHELRKDRRFGEQLRHPN